MNLEHGRTVHGGGSGSVVREFPHQRGPHRPEKRREKLGDICSPLGTGRYDPPVWKYLCTPSDLVNLKRRVILCRSSREGGRQFPDLLDGLPDRCLSIDFCFHRIDPGTHRRNRRARSHDQRFHKGFQRPRIPLSSDLSIGYINAAVSATLIHTTPVDFVLLIPA